MTPNEKSKSVDEIRLLENYINMDMQNLLIETNVSGQKKGK